MSLAWRRWCIWEVTNQLNLCLIIMPNSICLNFVQKSLLRTLMKAIASKLKGITTIIYKISLTGCLKTIKILGRDRHKKWGSSSTINSSRTESEWILFLSHFAKTALQIPWRNSWQIFFSFGSFSMDRLSLCFRWTIWLIWFLPSLASLFQSCLVPQWLTLTSKNGFLL